MSAWVARIACLIAVLVGGLSDSHAADLAEFNAAVEDVSAHNRVAIERYGRASILAEIPKLDKITRSTLRNIQPELDLAELARNAS